MPLFPLVGVRGLTMEPIIRMPAVRQQSREIAVIPSSARIENDLERLGTPGRD